MWYRFLVIFFLIWTSITVSAFAQDDYVPVKQWQLSLGVGYGVIETPIAGVDDLAIYLLPNISYYGEQFFIENTTLGYALYEQGPLIVDLVGKVNDDGLYFKFDDIGVLAATGLDIGRNDDLFDINNVERDVSYLAGLAVNYDFQYLATSARWYQDISGVHHGNEFVVSIAKTMRLADLGIALEVTANRKSHDLINYYYQIQAHESIIFVGLYQPNSYALNYTAKASVDYTLSTNWSLFATYHKTWLDSAISDSPIIDKSSIELFFTGVKYRF